jgi:hypothetical protein
MFEELLNEIGSYAVELIQKQIITPEPRYTKRKPEMLKARSPYNFSSYKNSPTSSPLYQSVSYEVRDEEIDIIMLDYGADYVFGGGSWPGGGRFSNGKGTGTSELLPQLEGWVKRKIGLSGAKARSMAFAVRKNLFKNGYKGFNLFNENFNEKINQKVEELLLDERFTDPLLREYLGDVFDRLNIFGQETYDIALS